MSSWRIKPAIGQVLVRPLDNNEAISKGGIILPVPQSAETGMAQVVEICDPYPATSVDPRSGPMWEVGQIVLIGKYNGRDVIINRERFIMIRETDIMGTLHEEEDAKIQLVTH